MTLEEAAREIFSGPVKRAVISKPTGKDTQFRRVVIERKAGYFQAARYTNTQIFHLNIPEGEAAERFPGLCEGFSRVNVFSADGQRELLIGRDGGVTMKRLPAEKDLATAEENPDHDRKKNYILREGEIVPPLVDMGVMTKDGKIISSMHDKFRQVNRFLEIIGDEIRQSGKRSYRMIDFGCGKSYLTFVVYYYFSEVLSLDVEIVGIDLKKAVVEKCGAAAKKYGYKNLRFEVGDINGYAPPFKPDIVMSLHACDTATDHALFNAVMWGSEMIFSVPCCQHELNAQTVPADIFTRYGIIKERFCALATDAVRAEMLELCGYKTQLLEFVDFEHTPKNILIRARKRPFTPDSVKERARKDIEDLTERYGFRPTICQLLGSALSEEGK
ncbi:MAG: SAM-dependent methyltransferase [Clostridia bacterium]|nr:SAM-dependent methyltransferase [Clostridia bacterium]